jgi:hypothetical protein
MQGFKERPAPADPAKQAKSYIATRSAIDRHGLGHAIS